MTSKAYYQANKEAIKLAARNWKRANPEKVEAIKKAYYETHKEEIKSKHRQKRRDDPIKARAQDKSYRHNNRARIIMATAKQAGYPITDSIEIVQWYLDNQKVCQICGSSDSGVKNRPRLYIDHDHVTGRVRGMLCHDCNMTVRGLEHARKVVGYLEKHEVQSSSASSISLSSTGKATQRQLTGSPGLPSPLSAPSA